MLRLLIPAATAVALLAGCTGSLPGPGLYQRDITVMAGHCTQAPWQLEAMVAEVQHLEERYGRPETVTGLAGHLAAAVSPFRPKRSCAAPFGAYLAAREGRCLPPGRLPLITPPPASPPGTGITVVSAMRPAGC